MPKLNILCVDDQREVLAALKKDLSFFESVAVLNEAESADEAEEIIKELGDAGEPLFLIVCDHVMPGENGVDFMGRMLNKDDLKATKRILLTGLADQQDTIRAINDAKIDLYMEKPWDGDELLKAVKGLLVKYVQEKKLDMTEYQEFME
ncbi:response regulator [bacterium]|nr:response regulator [bacterium]